MSTTLVLKSSKNVRFARTKSAAKLSIYMNIMSFLTQYRFI